MVADRMLVRTFLIALTVCTVAAEAYGQTSATIARGQDIAGRACAGCHAIDGQAGGTIQGTNVPSFRAIASRPNRSPARLQAFIMTPQHPMPGTLLTLSEVNDVVAYLLSLR
jgi:mono/diheme cytochrome c family protein